MQTKLKDSQMTGKNPQLSLLVDAFGVSPYELVESLQCFRCGKWSVIGEWLCAVRMDLGLFQTKGLKCPDCGYFHSPFDGPIQYTTSDEIHLSEQQSRAVSRIVIGQTRWVKVQHDRESISVAMFCSGWSLIRNQLILTVQPTRGLGEMRISAREFFDGEEHNSRSTREKLTGVLGFAL